jgi:hypothetical protein
VRAGGQPAKSEPACYRCPMRYQKPYDANATKPSMICGGVAYFATFMTALGVVQ